MRPAATAFRRAKPAPAGRAAAKILIVGGILACTACRHENQAPKKTEPTPSLSGPVPAPPLSVPRPPPPAPCRAIQVRGQVTLSPGGALKNRHGFDRDQWISLVSGAEVVIKHAASGREIIVEGPGRVMPCRGGEEQLLVSSGRVRSVPGAGARPGAEVWLVTPWGVVRYGDAALELGVTEGGLSITVSGGQAATDPAAGVTTLPKTVAGPRGKARATGKPNPARLAEACQRAAVAAQRSAAVLLADRPGPDLGRHARDQLEDRRRARAACATAFSAADRVSDASQQGRLRDQLARAESLWRAVPEAPPAAPK